MPPSSAPLLTLTSPFIAPLTPLTPTMALLVIFLGAGFGGLARYGVSLALPPLGEGEFPIATLLINVVGSAFLAAVSAWFTAKDESFRLLYLALSVGFAGGFTTFSTFSVEALRLFQSGHERLGLFYILASVLLSIFAAFGAWVAVSNLSAP